MTVMRTGRHVSPRVRADLSQETGGLWLLLGLLALLAVLSALTL